jgi:hypothetical protein
MLDQEGLAGLFSQAMPALARAEIAEARAIIHGIEADTAPYPVIFAALYGDDAARELGYQPLGLPPRAGFDVALADALEHNRDPSAAV